MGLAEANPSEEESTAVTRLLTLPVTRWSALVLAIALFAIANLPWHLDDYDQAKQAFTSFEMVERGHWFYQHTPNWWVATKPPLVGWISAGIFAVTRSWELAWRLPSFLAALALLVWIFRSATAYGSVAAVTAASAFSFNLFAPRLASLVRTDMPLALVLFAIGWLVWEKIRTRKAWTRRDRVLLFLFLTAGMLIKGPIVFAFLLPGLLAFQWRWRGTTAATSAWSGWLPWLFSFLIFVLWVAGGILFVPEFAEHVVLREFAGRFRDEVHRAQPFYFYLAHLLHRFAPWSLLLIGLLLVAATRTGPSRSAAPGPGSPLTHRIGATLREISPEIFWLAAWSLGGLVVMSFIPSKRIDRIFPVVPPLCLLLAAIVGVCREKKQMRLIVDRSCAVALIFAIFFTSGYTVRRIVLASRERRDAFAVFGRAVVKEAATHGWRYGVVGGEDEGMLLYVRRTEFLEPEQAAADWSARKLDALVVPDDEIQDLVAQLHGGEPKKLLTSEPAGSYGKRYFLLVRRSSP
jgi:4-amino-4-deoxy-L-arabinose transferase-like glycosyltransferase